MTPQVTGLITLIQIFLIQIFILIKQAMVLQVMVIYQAEIMKFNTTQVASLTLLKVVPSTNTTENLFIKDGKLIIQPIYDINDKFEDPWYR